LLCCSFVVGMGVNPPTCAQNPAASCPPNPASCNYVNNYLSSTPNTNILYGALVEGNGFSDNFVVCCSHPALPKGTPPHTQKPQTASAQTG